MPMIPDSDALLAALLAIHAAIRDAVVAACEQQSLDQLAHIAGDAAGDTIYAIDRVSEAVLVDLFRHQIAPRWSLILIAEGLPEGQICLPHGTPPAQCQLRIIVDPIDGTRGLMYQKRSAWILTGVAPNYGDSTRLRHIELAVQTEIPLIKQHLSDELWATSTTPTQARRYNRLNQTHTPLPVRPSQATSIAHGFAMISRFFPGARDELAAIDEAVVQSVLGPPPAGKAICFEDQYISTGGQLYELLMGHDRFIADLRPLLDQWLARQSRAQGICCHPYDLAAWLVAQQAGVLLTGGDGGVLDAPLDLHTDVAWIGYANAHIRQQIEPVLLAELRRRGFLSA